MSNLIYNYILIILLSISTDMFVYYHELSFLFQKLK